MKKHYSLKWFLAGFFTAVVITATAVLLYLYVPFETRAVRPDSMAAVKKVGEVERIIRSRSITVVDEAALTDSMLRGLVKGVDDIYAEYFTREEYAEILRLNAGLTKGIGISIAQDETGGFLTVVQVQEGSPADEAGVREGDILLSINGVDMKGKNPSDAAERIRTLDEPIVLRLERGEKEQLELTMEKADIRGNAVEYSMLENQIGYIRIRTFNNLTSEQFAEAYAALQEQKMTALIMDLRDNRGGLVQACCETADQILPQGVIVYEQDRFGKEAQRDSVQDTPLAVPAVILVNGFTASASEIFTGAVRDYGLATIVGEQTYGKGIEQNTYLLSDGSALKLTTEIYYTPKRVRIDGVGITPDIVVEQPSSSVADVQLERAIEILSADSELPIPE